MLTTAELRERAGLDLVSVLPASSVFAAVEIQVAAVGKVVERVHFHAEDLSGLRWVSSMSVGDRRVPHLHHYHVGVRTSTWQGIFSGSRWRARSRR